MALTKGKLGSYIELRDVRNRELKYGVKDVRGVNTSKQMMPTKADLTTRDLSKFQILAPEEFVFNHRTSRNGSKFSIAFNDTGKPIICTEDYVVFRISDYGRKFIVPEWLYMYFNRPEFDRFVITNSWGSSTEFYNWEDICDVDMALPPLSVQQKYVDIYNSMLANQRCYERGLEDLKLTCEAYIENLRKQCKSQRIGEFLIRKNDRNNDKRITKVMGLSTKKQFREPQSRVKRDELGNYKIVLPNEFAFVPTTDTWKVLAYAVNEFCESIVVSPIYEVFAVNATVIYPQYLAIWLSRNEFDRYARFNSWGSARENFNFDDMCDVELPIPDISVQKAIADIFTAYNTRKEINERLKAQIKDLCPILVKGAVEEGERE